MKFLNLFDITVEISLLIVLIGTINRLLKKKLDPNIRYFLWIFVAIRLLLPLRIELSVELPNLDLFDTAAEYMQDSRTDETATAEAVSAPLPAAPVRDIAPAMPQQPPSLTDAQTVPERAAVSGKAVAQFVWILGMVSLSGYVLVSNGRVFLSFRKKRRKLESLDSKIPVYAMPGYNCLAGIVSPAIYVDTDVLGSSEVIQNVISHELQHYRARDHYWQLLRVICLILQWHNPLMWWAYFASRKDCEIACDARVVRYMTSEERFGYGSSLLTAAEIACRRNQAVLCSTSMSGNKSFLRERIHGIMQYKCKYAIALITVIILVIGVGCFASFHLYANEEKGQKAAPENSAIAESEPEHRPKEPLPYSHLIQTFTQEETAVVPGIKEYDFTSAKEVGTVQQIHGMLPGLGEGTWYTIAIDGVEYYYGQYDFQEDGDAEFYGYAIFSDKYSLINGLSVGMTTEEVLKKYPYMAITDFDGNELSYLNKKSITGYLYLGWNGSAYPRSYIGMDENWAYNGKDYAWSDQFDYIMFAEIDQGTTDTLPVSIGLLVSGNTVSAITFYYPTAN